MTDHIYKHIEVTGTSPVGTDDAIRKAVARAATTVHDMRWFVVTDTRGHINEAGAVEQWQVTIKIGFCLDD
jgi:flavin-binding protein dodecin